MTNQEFQKNLQKMRTGNQDGLKAVYDEYAGAVYAVFLSLVKNPQDAEDLTADLFLKLWDKADSFRPGTGHKGWLFTMARNLGRDFLRRKAREVPGDIPEDIPSPMEEELLSQQLSFEELLSPLDADARRIVTLKLLGGFPLREIAGLLKLPMGTVAWKYRNALTAIKEAVKDEQ